MHITDVIIFISLRKTISLKDRRCSIMFNSGHGRSVIDKISTVYLKEEMSPVK